MRERFASKTGTLYYEKHLRGRRKDGTPIVFHIWTAEVNLCGRKYRKKSKDRAKCVLWLQKVELYKKGIGEFPARLNHPGEDPRRDSRQRRPSRAETADGDGRPRR